VVAPSFRTVIVMFAPVPSIDVPVTVSPVRFCCP
jgi:hypothetical protein